MKAEEYSKMKVTIRSKAAPAAAKAFFGGKKAPAEYRALLDRLEAAGRFDPNAAAVKTVDAGEGVLILLGKPADDVRHFKDLVARAFREAAGEKAETLELDLGSYDGALEPALAVRAAAQACLEAAYRFDYYLEKKSECPVKEVRLLHADAARAALKKAAALGAELGEAVCAARDAVNRTSWDMTPETLAKWAAGLCGGAPAEVELLDRAALEKLGAKSLLSVSRGAANPPMMAVLRYRGDPKHPQHITALIGKGITYDSGGLSLKSKDGMITMHGDMGGAAATGAAFSVIARSGMKLNVTAILPICENMLSPEGYRPGDVIGSMDGKTIQIRSTDAEGRLVLIDAMTYAIRCEKAERLVDIATLTGGAAKAYGPLVSAVAVTDETLRAGMKHASETSGDLMWEMPFVPDYISFLRTSHADIANSSIDAGSSMINAAVFLSRFTDGKPWMHIDIAGKSWVKKTEGCFCEGGTGVGTAALYDLCDYLAQSK